MPELPEVETILRGLQPVMEGRRILQARAFRPDLRFALPPRMEQRLAGTTILGLRRRSKYLLVDLSSAETLLIHLGMSGRLLVSGVAADASRDPHPPVQKHDHVVFDLSGGARVTFNDPRRFGMMDLFATASAPAHRLLADLGPEPLGNDLSEDGLSRRLAGRATSIKAALLDQHNIAGLGNIYVCEALHRAGIAPTRPAGQVSRDEIARLVPIIREVLREAIAAGGSSLRDFRQASGELGYFQHNFRVYGREGQPCPTPGCIGSIARIVQSGRSTFCCPVCQS